MKHDLLGGGNDRITWCSERGELVEEVGVFLPAAHAAHCADLQRQIPDQLACGQLVHLQDILHVMQIVDQQVALVHTGDEACRRIENSDYRQVVLGLCAPVELHLGRFMTLYVAPVESHGGKKSTRNPASL